LALYSGRFLLLPQITNHVNAQNNKKEN